MHHIPVGHRPQVCGQKLLVLTVCEKRCDLRVRVLILRQHSLVHPEVSAVICPLRKLNARRLHKRDQFFPAVRVKLHAAVELVQLLERIFVFDLVLTEKVSRAVGVQMDTSPLHTDDGRQQGTLHLVNLKVALGGLLLEGVEQIVRDAGILGRVVFKRRRGGTPDVIVSTRWQSTLIELTDKAHAKHRLAYSLFTVRRLCINVLLGERLKTIVRLARVDNPSQQISVVYFLTK